MPAIAILDSGVGGTTVLEAVRERAPWADLLYIADHSFGPYGERSLGEVRHRTELLARYLDSSGVSVIVIACNSASAAALHYLRETLPDLTFVGMEPAVKPAVEMTNAGVVGVLATGATFQGELFHSLVGIYGDEVEIVEQACPGLAAAIEAGSPVGEMLDRFLAPVRDAGADVVVLGCTHYPLIRDEIENRLPPGVSIIDPAPSVAKRVLEVAYEEEVDLDGSGSTRWWSTALKIDRGDDRAWETIDVSAGASGAIRVGESTISVVQGDLTTMSVDAITNAANVELRHGGGIALAITNAGGPVIEEESREWIETYGPLEPGIAALTSAGHMPASYVIHVAGPIYREGQENEALLTAAIFATLDMASEIEIATVALPAISAGIYGYPPADAALVIAQGTAAYLSDRESTLRGVRLVGFDAAMTQHFVQALTTLD